MKNLLLIIGLLCIIQSAQTQTDTNVYYLSTNVLSPLAGINKSITAANVLVPLVSNLEYGFTISGGLIKNYHSFETRLTYGKSNEYNRIPQVQFGWNFFIFDYFKHNQSGWYVGSFARYWLYYNKYTEQGLQNITTNITLGYLWKKNRMIYDFRLNQPLTIYSWSTIEHTKSGFEVNMSPMPEFSPVLPFISINIGYAF